MLFGMPPRSDQAAALASVILERSGGSSRALSLVLSNSLTKHGSRLCIGPIVVPAFENMTTHKIMNALLILIGFQKSAIILASVAPESYALRTVRYQIVLPRSLREASFVQSGVLEENLPTHRYTSLDTGRAVDSSTKSSACSGKCVAHGTRRCSGSVLRRR